MVFNLVEVFGLACYYPANFYTRTVFVSTIPIVIVAVMLVTFKIVRRSRLRKEHRG